MWSELALGLAIPLGSLSIYKFGMYCERWRLQDNIKKMKALDEEGFKEQIKRHQEVLSLFIN